MLDNTFLQIAVGFIPAILFFAFMSIFSKKNRIRNIICTGTFFFVASGLALPQLFEIGNQPPHKYDELSLVYAIAEEGSPELAKTLLGEMQNDYKPEYAIAAARLSAESGDYQGAKALYLKSLPLAKEVESEYSALVDLSEIDDKYYGISDEAEAQLIYSARADKLSQTSNTISTAVEDSIKETENNTYNKMAEYIVYADQVYKDYLYEEEIDKAEAEKQTKKLNIFLEKNPEFLKSNQVRLARLKLLLLSGDYKKIAASLSEDSDYNELLIVSELYLNNYVKQSNFSDEYLGESKEKYDAVYKKLNDIYSNSFQDKPREERNLARSQLNALKTIVENPALGKMEEALSEYASKEYAIDASKAYLQMAKIEHSLGNNPKSVEYIDRSIDTVGDCEDSDYTVPMYELVGIITDKDDPERLKDAAVYVDQVLENNMTIKISSHENTIKPESDEDSFAGDFTSQMQTYISQKRMSVNIVNIDTRDFDSDNTIKATVNISNNLYTSVDELKAALSINDCGVDIPDFTVEKVNYSGANILLCVDTSGSMSGYKIDNLKNAIKIFAADKSNIEDIALVTFSNGVGNDYPFGLSVDELSTAADSIRASGGTAIYKSVLHSIGKFMDNPDVINSIIVMTDGLDGYRASIEEIEEYIGKPSIEKGITIYTIGFGGDADGSYLNSIASATGGAYLYANEPTSGTQVNQLGEFFNGLRAQILNQYIITLKAKDTLSYSRELKVTVDHGLESDSATYYLGGGADSITDPGIDEDSPIYMNGKAINGFEPRMIYKNGKTLNTTLKGERFTAQDNINITLKGNTSGVEWDIGANFVDENSVSVTIPAGIGVDVYDVYVTINGKAAILPKGLSVFTQGSEKLTDFGPYRFVSYLKHEDKENNTMTLSGYVTMNGWLSFKEDITLSGNLKDDSITLTDMYGSSVFYDDQNSQGLASVLADVGLPVIIPALKTIRLYNDPEHEKQSGDFRVVAVPIKTLGLGKYFTLSQLDVRIYPNRVSFEARNITANLPFANNILKNKADLFSFDYGFGGTVSSKNIGVKIDLEYGAGKSLGEAYFPVNLGNMPIYISPQDTELHIDTFENVYDFKFVVKTAFIASQNALGLSAKWGGLESLHSNGLVPTEFKLYADFDINTIVSGVPITYSDFMLGIEDIDTSKKPVHWTFVGGCDISAAKVSAVKGLGGLEDWIGDVSVLKLDDARLSLNLGEHYIKADTTLKLFEELDCGSVLVEMGKFTYTNKLLSMKDDPVAGLRAKVTVGPNWDFGDSSLKIQGALGFDALNRFIGLGGSVKFDIDFRVWIICIGTSKDGEIAVGVRRTSDGTTAFVVRSNPELPNGGITWPKNVAGRL